MNTRKTKRSIPYLFQYSLEREERESVKKIPFKIKLRGIYALFQKRGENFNVVYIGMSAKDIRNRLLSHHKKIGGWTHFSFFKVWPNIPDEEIKELEGLFLHIYCKDSRAMVDNIIRGQRNLRKLRIADLDKNKEILKNFEHALNAFPDFERVKIHIKCKEYKEEDLKKKKINKKYL